MPVETGDGSSMARKTKTPSPTTSDSEDVIVGTKLSLDASISGDASASTPSIVVPKESSAPVSVPFTSLAPTLLDDKKRPNSSLARRKTKTPADLLALELSRSDEETLMADKPNADENGEDISAYAAKIISNLQVLKIFIQSNFKLTLLKI